MHIKFLKEAFLAMCLKYRLKKNHEQIQIVEKLIIFYENITRNTNFLSRLFFPKAKKIGFYLQGDVGVGKTMILNFFFDFLTIPKQRLHFNEFMITVHDFLHANKDKAKNENLLELFVNQLKKRCKIIYFDEFQVTNIVDAMILGKLFQCIFHSHIMTIFSSNTKIDDLYKDGLQREQFLPFITVIKKYCVEEELVIKEDYRKSGIKTLERFFSPNDEKNIFKVNQLFRELTKDKKLAKKIVTVKGRNFSLNHYYEGIVRFDFKELCQDNLGAEDYILISDHCSFINIDNIPNFNDENLNEQQRFITLIDILYEKKIPLMASCEVSLENFSSSKKLIEPFKRTLSRLYELTSPGFKVN